MGKEKPTPYEIKVTSDQSKILETLESDVSTSEEAQAKAVMTLTRRENIEMLSDLGDDEIKLLTSLSAVGEELKDPLILKVCNSFAVYRVSKSRMGRKEIARMVGSMREEQEKMSKLKRIFGMGR